LQTTTTACGLRKTICNVFEVKRTPRENKGRVERTQRENHANPTPSVPRALRAGTELSISTYSALLALMQKKTLGDGEKEKRKGINC